MEGKSSVIRVTAEDYSKMLHWASIAISPDTKEHQEIGGYGQFDPVNGIVRDLMLINQTVGTSDIIFNMESLAPILAEAKNPENYRVFWHSHGHHKVYLSATDDDHIDDFGKAVDWLISIVVNAEGDVGCWIDYFRPVRVRVECLLQPHFELSTSVQRSMLSELNQKVIFRKPPPPPVVVNQPPVGEYPFFPGWSVYDSTGRSAPSLYAESALNMCKSVRKRLVKRLGPSLKHMKYGDIKVNTPLLEALFESSLPEYYRLSPFYQRRAVESLLVRGQTFDEFKAEWLQND